MLQLNINPGNNEKLMASCRSLHDYMKYVNRVRSYSGQMAFQEAVEKAVSECIKEGKVKKIFSLNEFVSSRCLPQTSLMRKTSAQIRKILEQFLRVNRAEVIQMSIFEYDEELHMATLKKESWEDGWEDGWQQGKKDGWEQGIAWGNRRLLAVMLKRGLSPEKISELTGESVDTIREAASQPDFV